MKFLFLFIGLLMSINPILAQPQKIHYQAIAVGANGKPIKNSTVGLRLSVLDSLPTGSTLYTETQAASTDAAGQFSIYLGGGTATAGTFANLPWANGNDKFLKVEMDAQGGTNYLPMGTTQLVSVPYAMAAGTSKELNAGTIFNGSAGKKWMLIETPNGPTWTCYPPVTLSSAGPDQLSLTGTTATLAANAPAAGETGAWSILAGSGGSLSASNNPTATFTKGTDSVYTLVWTISGPCGTTTDTLNLRFPAPVGTACGQAITYAGESYPTVQIGTQCWFTKNLNVGTMINGGSDQTNNSTIEKYCYNDYPADCATYGGLYQWAEAVQYQNGASNITSPSPAFTVNLRGICPTGWHLPSDAEWSSLETTLGGSSVAGGALKSTSSLWIFPNTGATNSSGFSALPGGLSTTNGIYIFKGNFAYFWSSSESSATNAVVRELYYEDSGINRIPYPKNTGFSARCIKD